jgi:SAM-dependent methyltransferase
VGQAMRGAPALFGPNARLGVIGLGTGTLACYRTPGQSITFFEIDPLVVRLARTSGRFTFLKNCAPDARIVLGDARLTLGQAAPGAFDVLAVDAFSSDSVPMHLLTREAFEVYARTLRASGVLAIHISNRYLDLRPVLAAAAAGGGWQATLVEHSPDREESLIYQTPSSWVLLSRDPASLTRLRTAVGADALLWKPLRARPGFTTWSDDYATILPLLRNLSL